jgi:signal peptidase I
MTALTIPTRSRTGAAQRYSRLRLTAGLAGRAWIWFLVASFVVGMLPILFGWTSLVITTGSMEPGIGAGDVVLVSPNVDLDTSIGRVIAFEDPARIDHVLTHRLVSIGPDGTLITRGDANPTNDSLPVAPDAVIGQGRLLIRGIGLPVLWMRTRDWAPLVAHLVLLVAAVIAVVYDYEPVGRSPSWGRMDHRLPGDANGPLAHRAPSMTILFVVAATALGTWADRAPASGAAFTASTSNTNDSWTIPNWSYAGEVLNRGPYLYWKLDETSTATTASDASGNGRTGTYTPNGSSTNFTRLANGALVTDTPDRAVTLMNANACINTTSTTAIAAPQTFTVIAWFRAPSSYTGGGKLVGFERPRTGVQAPTNGAYDRHLYMDGQGRIWFGVYNNGDVVLSSGTGFNDNAWHMAVGTQGSAGMRLYVDGVQVGSNNNTVAETQNGWWRAGCGNLSGWGAEWGGPNNPGTDSTTTQNRPFVGSLDEVAVFTTALTAQQVAFLYWTR